MPILNPVHKGEKLFMSEFFCPNCFVPRPYDIRPVSKNSTFYPIPFSESNKPSHVVECQFCKNAYDPNILKRNIQILFKLVSAAKYQLDQGTSPGYLKLQLISDGLKEGFADRLITLAQH
ncbi:MAG: hypothetical protein ACXW4Q_14640 [Anaerolineales bacterium]